MKRIILITGGQRSGKSRQAEELALSLSEQPVYLATAHIWDDEFRERVNIHQQRRGPQWTTIEEERWLSRHDVSGRVVVIDCVTLWLTNFFTETSDVQQTLETAKAEALKPQMALSNPAPFKNWRGTLGLVDNGDGTSTIVVNYKTVGLTILFR